jgi:hypothetical protein
MIASWENVIMTPYAILHEYSSIIRRVDVLQ